MAYTSSLYYPFIEIQDQEWLRTSCLYWDVIRTIAPRSIKTPYRNAESRELEEEGVLVPYYVDSGLDVVTGIADEFIAYLETEAAKVMLLGGKERLSYIHPDKLSPSIQRLTHIHPEKLPYEIHHLFEESQIP